MRIRFIHMFAALLAAIVAVPCPVAAGQTHTIRLPFNEPMSWADNGVVWGLGSAVRWDIVNGGKYGKGLRISAAADKVPFCYEVRTLQINHKPGTPVRIRFDVKTTSLPAGASLTVRHFDGYCTAEPFVSIADEKFRPFPKPLWESGKSNLDKSWERVTLDTGVLKNTVLTLAFIIRQNPPEKEGTEVTEFVEFFLDNLTIETQPLETLMDPGFDWHGVSGGSTMEFRYSTKAANSDWCSFADQEDVKYWNGQTIHYTLLQFREASTRKGGWPSSILGHDVCLADIGGLSVVAMKRPSAGQSSAVSWGVRQTVTYSAFGLKQGRAAKLRVTMKMTNDDSRDLNFSRVQLGVDPNGGIDTHKATWTDESLTILTKGGWDTTTIEFDKPAGAQAFTIYFRHLDGLPGGPTNTYPLPEVEGRGSPYGCAAYTDWVMVEVVK